MNCCEDSAKTSGNATAARRARRGPELGEAPDPPDLFEALGNGRAPAGRTGSRRCIGLGLAAHPPDEQHDSDEEDELDQAGLRREVEGRGPDRRSRSRSRRRRRSGNESIPRPWPPRGPVTTCRARWLTRSVEVESVAMRMTAKCREEAGDGPHRGGHHLGIYAGQAGKIRVGHRRPHGLAESRVVEKPPQPERW